MQYIISLKLKNLTMCCLWELHIKQSNRREFKDSQIYTKNMQSMIDNLGMISHEKLIIMNLCK